MNHIIFMMALFLISGCLFDSYVKVDVKNPSKKNAGGSNITVSNIQVINHQVVITGTNLASVSGFKIKEGANTTTLNIESQTNTSIIANTISNVTFAAGKMFNFVLSSADASSTFSVDFSLCNATTAPAIGFDCSTPNNNDVLSFDATAQKWIPRSMNGLSYRGTWDASGAPPASTTAGDYYIVSVAGAGYSVGDWTVCRGGAVYDKINNSTVITNVFGRTGAITPVEGDYILTEMGDVDLTTNAPVPGDYLTFNGTNWVPGAIVAGGGGTVTGVTATAPIVSSGGSAPVVSITQATTATNGYLSSADWNTFNNKEPAITAQATTTFFRGDKTFVTLDTSIVPENTNLYFNNARAIGATLTGFVSGANSAILATDTVLGAFQKTQGQISALSIAGGDYVLKAGGSTLAGTTTLSGQINVTAGTGLISIADAPSLLTDAANKQYVDTKLALSGGTVTGDVSFNTLLKLKDGATNYVTLKAPATVTSSYVLTLPTTAGSANQILTTDGFGVTSWSTPASTDVSGTTLSTYAMGANTALSNSDTVVGAFGKLQGQLNEVLSKALTGLSTATNAVITSTDTIVGAFGKLQKQISDLAVSSVGGDLSGNLPNPTVVKIQGKSVSAAAPANGQFLKYNSVGTNWEPSAVTVGDLKSTALGSLFPGTGCNANQTLYYSVVGDAFSCLDIGSLDGAKITTGTIDAARLPSSPYVIGGTFVGVFANSQILVQHPFPINVTIPQNCTNSRFEVATAATASTTITMKKCTAAGFTSCTTFGTGVIAGGAKVATFTCASATSFVGGTDSLLITTPASADATAATAGWAIYGTK